MEKYRTNAVNIIESSYAIIKEQVSSSQCFSPAYNMAKDHFLRALEYLEAIDISFNSERIVKNLRTELNDE